MKKTITCISCPIGCLVEVEQAENGEIVSISGNTCKRGESYAHAECTAPVRMVTSLVRVKGADEPLCVKTAQAVPKDKIPQVLSAIHSAKISLPVRIGDVVIADVCGTGVDVVATRRLG